ncbi:hypothetical protein [Methanobrevibacter sp.]
MKLGEGQSQLVKEFGVIKLLAEDVSEEKAIETSLPILLEI